MQKRFLSSFFLVLMVLPLMASKSFVLLSPNKTFGSQCSQENTIYEVRYDFDLKGKVVHLPKGCTLKLNGGSINNGTIYLLSNTKIVGTGEKVNCLILGVEQKNVDTVVIDGIEMEGYKNAAVKMNDIVTGIKVLPGGSVNGFTVSNCRIHGYNTGISLRGSNVTIKDNVFYDNGHESTVGGVHDNEVDACVGYSPNEPETCNFIVTGNRCLSKNVHRNIDCGELLSENNIIISNNICVSMDGVSREISSGFRKSQCILVGYTGLSEKCKAAIISNNICKHCSWGGIYVRADNTENTSGSNGYVAMITGNYIENVVKTPNSMFGAGIACELREGSIISNNIIRNCTQGINIGQVFLNGHVKVFGNSIDNCDYGILNDAVARKIDITDNSIINVHNQGIVITEATSASVDSEDKFVTISNNTITFSSNKSRTKMTQSEGCSTGIFLYNVGTVTCRVNSNFVYGKDNKKDIGIQFRCNSKASSLTIRDNYVNGCNVGINRIPGSDVASINYRLMENVIENCVLEKLGL